MNDFLNDKEVERAIRYLASSAEDYSIARARMKHLEHHRKSVRASEFLRASGSSAAERAEMAEASTAYNEVVSDYKDAVAEFTLIDAKRHAADTWVDVWKVQEYAKRRGNI